MVRVPDFESGGPGFKSHFGDALATFVNSQLVCLLPVGIFNMLCSI